MRATKETEMDVAIVDRLGVSYKLRSCARKARDDFYTAYVNNRAGQGRFTSKPWDVCVQIGGALYCLTNDGELVFGYNNFPNSELIKALEWFKKIQNPALPAQ
jgi:hypothetical protein